MSRSQRSTSSPFQKVTKISITPFDFSMALQAMTSEKLQFSRKLITLYFISAFGIDV